PHPRRADLPLPFLRPAPATGRPGAPQAARRLGVRASRHRLLGSADAAVLHARDPRDHPDPRDLSAAAPSQLWTSTWPCSLLSGNEPVSAPFTIPTSRAEP